MNFDRRSPCEDLLFLMVLLLPPVSAGACYVESDRQFAHILRLDPKRRLWQPALCPGNGGSSGAVKGMDGTEPERLARPARLRRRSKLSGRPRSARAVAALYSSYASGPLSWSHSQRAKRPIAVVKWRR